MSIIINIIYFVLVLSVIIVIHEIGHLIAAKMFNVYCGEFSLGMGPVIYKKKFKETQYSLRALPIGGFVQMAGEEDAKGEEYDSIPKERTIKGIKVWKQIIVMLAGVFMNIVLAFVIFLGINLYTGEVVVTPRPLVESIVENSPAEESGLQKGDLIVSIKNKDGKVFNTKTLQDVLIVQSNYDGELEYTIKRGNETFVKKMTPEIIKDSASSLPSLGFMVKKETKQVNALESVYYANEQLVNGVVSIKDALVNLVQGVGLKNLSGPVGIFQITSDYADAGIIPTLSLIAILSLNVGIFNLIPLPILDGGRVVMITISKIIGKPINEKFETIVMYVAALLLVALLLFATWQDILKLFS